MYADVFVSLGKIRFIGVYTNCVLSYALFAAMVTRSGSSGILVDYTAFFSRFIRSFYTNFECFLDDFHVLQKETFISFYVCENEGAASWLPTYPRSFRYYRVKYSARTIDDKLKEPGEFCGP